jgi:hypothetical protein
MPRFKTRVSKPTRTEPLKSRRKAAPTARTSLTNYKKEHTRLRSIGATARQAQPHSFSHTTNNTLISAHQGRRAVALQSEGGSLLLLPS